MRLATALILKAQTREKRCTGPTQQRRVELSCPIPRNWEQFFCLNENKTELFKLLNNELVASATESGSLSLLPMRICVPARAMPNLAPCNHEEADSRIMVHVADAIMLIDDGLSKDPCSNSRYWRSCARSSCSATARKSRTLDCIWYWQELLLHPCSWDMCITWSTEIGGTSRVSCFHRLRHCIPVCPSGKKWLHGKYGLHNSPQQISEETEASLEHFTILLYDRATTCTSINEVRKLLFTHKGHQMSALPPRLPYSNILEGQSCNGDISGLVLRRHII